MKEQKDKIQKSTNILKNGRFIIRKNKKLR
jgi:hypothetical protein